MGKAERQMKRALGIKLGKKDEVPKVTFLKDSFLGKTWYLDGIIEKLIFILGFFALAYSIIRILLQGWW